MKMNKHREFCRRAAADGMVLLKNDNQVLPLDKKHKIAVFGRGQYMTVKSGEGSGNVCGVEVVHMTEAMKNADISYCEALMEYGYQWHMENGFKGLEFAHELYNYCPSIPEIPYTEDVIAEAAKETDTAVLIFCRRSGENSDIRPEKGNYYLTDEEVALMNRVRDSFSKMVVLLNHGERYDLTEILKTNPDSILYMSHGGQEVGNAVVDVLYGDVTPAAKLTGTWAKDYRDHLSTENYGGLEVCYKEGLYVGYRYFDTFNIEPLYPFGFGMSYTDFLLSNPDVVLEGNQCTVQVTVKNMGKYPGREVVQVYVSKPDGALENAYQDLAGFSKTRLLQPGESESVRVTFEMTEFIGYSAEKQAYILQGGDYYIRVGNSSRNTHIAACINVDRDVPVKQVKNLFEQNVKFDTVSKGDVKPYSYVGEAKEKEAAKKFCFDASVVELHTIVYDRKPIIPEKADKVYTLDDVMAGTVSCGDIVAQMTAEEKLSLFNGNCEAGDVQAGVIGCMSESVEGAAAETYEFPQYKIPKNICADGPAGIRLMSTGYDFRTISKEDKRRNLTAYPVSTCVANSWDLELNVEYGRNVAEEMEAFGIDGWLAPGMSIHRNPLCGRNFEYYSEDPVLSGRIAGAQTIGVQTNEDGSPSGKYVTLKHLALNNQEAYRCEETSEIDERTFRELYLRNFEIAVVEAKPLALMSSYNLINGVYASVHRALLTNVLRDEWGFEGIVMSDWGANGDPAKKLWAGNDLNMPGHLLPEMIKAYKEGKIADEDLFVCAERIVRFIKDTSYMSYTKKELKRHSRS